MTDSVNASIPLIDEALSDELFSLREDPEMIAMQRQIWHEFCMQVEPDLERALLGESENFESELHRIRGYCSSCGLSRLANLLHRWELEPGGKEAAKRFGSLALDIARRSIVAMNARYPHLGPTSSGRIQ
jgi:HPt (histidine-containing phosphotransfer) domain-containing protein